MANSKSPKQLKEKFFSYLEQAALNPNPEYIKGEAFSRHRKIGLLDTILFTASLQSDSVRKRVDAYNKAHKIHATTSAWCQRRALFDHRLIKDAGQLFARDLLADSPLFRDKYRLIGVDGSEVPVLPNPDEPDTLVPGHGQPHWADHFNAAFDLLNSYYVNYQIQQAAQKNENASALDFVAQYSDPGTPIWIFDRLYFSYQLAADIQERHHKFLFRMKNKPYKSLLDSDMSMQEALDCESSRMLINTQTAETRAFPDSYKYVAKGKVNQITEEKPEFFFPYRLVSVEIETQNNKTGETESVFEYLLTNLDPEEFSVEDIKDLYHLRWNIENSFRHLKYVLKAKQVHSRKQNLIEQEIDAAVMLYNLASAIQKCAQPVHKERKHEYQTNFKALTEKVWSFLFGSATQKEVIETIQFVIEPIRKNRHFKRSKHASVVTSTWQ